MPKLHQNRIVIVGRTVRDAYDFAQTPRFKDELESPTLVAAASHPTTIRGSLAGMHVGTVYITQTAPQAEHYDVVEEVLGHCKGKNPEMATVLESLVGR